MPAMILRSPYLPGAILIQRLLPLRIPRAKTSRGEIVFVPFRRRTDPLVAHLVESIRGPTYVLYTELNRIPAYFQLNGNNKRKKSEAVARTLTNTLI